MFYLRHLNVSCDFFNFQDQEQELLIQPAATVIKFDGFLLMYLFFYGQHSHKIFKLLVHPLYHYLIKINNVSLPLPPLPQAQHEGTTCQEYQDDLANKVDEAAMKTKKFFDVSIHSICSYQKHSCSYTSIQILLTILTYIYTSIKQHGIYSLIYITMSFSRKQWDD